MEWHLCTAISFLEFTPNRKGNQAITCAYILREAVYVIYMAKALLKKPFYHGSKSPYSVLGRWITSLIPWDYDTTYVEPFAGMLGILLGRQPVRGEIVNDLDGNLYNWWCVVRDEPDELSRLISATPRSRQGLADAYKIVDNPSNAPPVRRALALHVVLEQGIYRRMDSKPTWNIRVKPSGVRQDLIWTGAEIYPLACRLRHVQIENRDALDVLERVCEESDAVVYCDPPYPTADTTPYRERKFDIKRMADKVSNAKATVAISGYNDEWDMLGWERREHSINTATIHGREVRKCERTEVLWTNYAPPNQQTTIDV